MSLKLDVLYFAQVKEISGRDKQQIEFKPKDNNTFVATPEQILEKILEKVKTYDLKVQEPLIELMSRSMLAVDSEYCMDRAQELQLTAQTEIAVISPISGG